MCVDNCANFRIISRAFAHANLFFISLIINVKNHYMLKAGLRKITAKTGIGTPTVLVGQAKDVRICLHFITHGKRKCKAHFLGVFKVIN